MSKYAYNHVKADETIEEQKKRITELEGQIIQLNLELQHLREKQTPSWNEGDPTETGTYLCAYKVPTATEPYCITKLFFADADDDGWCGVPDGWELLGWMEIPKWEEWDD